MTSLLFDNRVKARDRKKEIVIMKQVYHNMCDELRILKHLRDAVNSFIEDEKAQPTEVSTPYGKHLSEMEYTVKEYDNVHAAHTKSAGVAE